MTKQVITFGTPPTGIGGDSYRTAFGKCNENFTEVYDKIAYFEGAPKAASSFSIYRDVLSNYRATATLKGALVIHLPKAKNKSTTMLSLRIRGYNYQSNNGEWDLQVGGYNYSSGWMQCSANLNGPAPFTQVQLGMASDHQVIIIGTASTVWAYPRFNIEEITAGYSNHASGWNTGLSVEYETDLSAYTGLVTPVLYGWTQVLTAEKLTTARTIGGVSFDGSANINLPGVNTAGNQSTSGNAASATKLQTARTIGGVSFNGTANINLPGVNTAGNQNTSGNAGSATILATARTINGTSFNGSANITTADWGTARTLTVGRTGKSVNGSANVAWSADEILPTGTNGQVLKHNGTSWVAGTDNNTTYSAMTAAEATTGTATTSRLITPAVLKSAITTHAPVQTTITGNAATATKLATARTINGTSFDGTANITITAAANGGNAATATKLATARTIGGVIFDGSANINLPGVNTAGNQNTTGNAATATKLSTASGTAPSYSARAWVNFNGTDTVAIKASGNVSSITDNGVGDYTINFTTAMPNANYAIAFGEVEASDGTAIVASLRMTGTTPILKTTSAFRFSTRSPFNRSLIDMTNVSAQVFG